MGNPNCTPRRPGPGSGFSQHRKSPGGEIMKSSVSNLRSSFKTKEDLGFK